MAERKSLVELVRSHPAVVIDHGMAAKHQNAAETGQRHPGKGDEQRDQTGEREWLDDPRLGPPVLNPGDMSGA